MQLPNSLKAWARQATVVCECWSSANREAAAALLTLCLSVAAAGRQISHVIMKTLSFLLVIGFIVTVCALAADAPAKGGKLRHVVAFKFKDTATKEQIKEVEDAFRIEPALIVNLLRLTNSVGVGARTRISSVRHAITILGRRQLQRWLQLLIFSRGTDIDFDRNPLLHYAALRARFMELLVERLHQNKRELRDPAFITGLMSVMPAALGLSMTDILAQIAVDNDVRLALSRHEGTLGQMLTLLDRYDANDIPGLQEALAGYGSGIHMGLMVEVLTEALLWVQQLNIANG